VMASVMVAFVVVLGFGFWFHQKPAGVSDEVFGGAAALALVAISFALVRLLTGLAPWDWRGIRGTHLLASRPVKMRPSPRAEARARAEAAYLEDLNATATCQHLQPMERAMRAAGIDVRLNELSGYGPVIKAVCRINDRELRRVFQLPPSVYYREGYEVDRGEYGTFRADIFCGYCAKNDPPRCDILVVHPKQCLETTPWFPSAEADARS
jgi:hypothetical protein